MRKIKETLRLSYQCGLSRRQVAHSLNVLGDVGIYNPGNLKYITLRLLWLLGAGLDMPLCYFDEGVKRRGQVLKSFIGGVTLTPFTEYHLGHFSDWDYFFPFHTWLTSLLMGAIFLNPGPAKIV